MHDLEVDTKLRRRGDKWSLEITGPQWAIEDMQREIHTNNTLLYVSGTHFKDGSGVRTIMFSQVDRALILRMALAQEPAPRVPCPVCGGSGWEDRTADTGGEYTDVCSYCNGGGTLAAVADTAHHH